MVKLDNSAPTLKSPAKSSTIFKLIPSVLRILTSVPELFFFIPKVFRLVEVLDAQSASFNQTSASMLKHCLPFCPQQHIISPSAQTVTFASACLKLLI